MKGQPMKQKLRRQQPRRSLLETFLQLCSMTTPEGHESYCWSLIPRGDGIEWYIDIDNNVHVYVYKPNADGKMVDSRIMWSCHLDTADYLPELVTFKRHTDRAGDMIIQTDGTTLLGADCKIGAAIMIKMIEARIPGWYAFHAGEESGRVGSDALAHRIANRIKGGERVSLPDICIAFDRMGTNDIITHQMGGRTASEAFAEALASIFNREQEFLYMPSSHGSYTDSFSYSGLIGECTNVSVGYAHQHTNWEEQNITHAQKLLDVILTNRHLFELLPAVRAPGEKEEKTPTGFIRDEKEVNQAYGAGSTSSDPIDSSPGTHAQVSPTPNGSKQDSSPGTETEKGKSSYAQAWGKATKKLTKKERRKLRKLERKIEAAKRRGFANTSKENDDSKSCSKTSKESQKSSDKWKHGKQKSEPVSSDSPDDTRPFVVEKTEIECRGWLRKPDKLGESTGSQERRQPIDWNESIGFSHGGHPSCSGYDDTFAIPGDDDYPENLFNELAMKYERGEMDEQEEEQFILNNMKRGSKRGVITPHTHGRLMRWYECNNCATLVRCTDALDFAEDTRCEDCGELVDPITYRYDADVKLYVPTTGDMTNVIPPHMVPF